MIRLALVGCGGISRTHAAQFQANSDLVRVVATCDPDLDRAQKAADVVGAPIAVADYREIMGDVDAALLALPHQLHHPIGMDFLRAGKHVLMEKPLANSESECLELIAEAKKQDVILMTAYCMRFHPLVEKLKEVLDSKKYGECFHLSIWTEQFTRWPDDDAWAHKIATLGGGQLFSHGCHYVDLLLHFLGNPVEGTHTGTNFGTPWMEREGTSDVSIKFENGAVGYHGGTWGARGSRLHYAFHAHCTDGFLEANFLKGQLWLVRGPEEELLFESTTGKHVEKEMRHFLECVSSGSKPETDAASSLQSLRVIWKLYEAEDARTVADLRGLSLQNAQQ